MRFFVFLLCATFAWSQQPPPTAPKPTVPPKGDAASSNGGSPNLIAPLVAQPKAVADDAVVLTVGDEKLTKAQFEMLVSTLPDQQRAQAATPQGRKQMALTLADIMTLAQEARAEKLDQTPKAAMQLRMSQNQLLANLMYRDLGEKAKPTEADLNSYYALHKSEWEEVKARHILIRFKGSQVAIREGHKDLTETEALALATDLRAKLVAGADFAETAKAESDDAGSGSNGGDLGTFKKGQMVAPFDMAAFSLPAGQISQPVKTQYGYHLIKVEAHTTKPFEEVRADVERRMAPEMSRKGLDDLKTKHPAVYDENYFGPAVNPPMPKSPPPVKP